MSGDANGPVIAPDPDNPGWFTWHFGQRDDGRFNQKVMAPLRIRKEEDGKIRLRMMPELRHTNPFGSVHGGIILSLIDISLFTTWRLTTTGEAKGAVTLELSNQFVGPGVAGTPIDALGEVVRETGRLVFIRGMVMQERNCVASYSGIIRKAS